MSTSAVEGFFPEEEGHAVGEVEGVVLLSSEGVKAEEDVGEFAEGKGDVDLDINRQHLIGPPLLPSLHLTPLIAAARAGDAVEVKLLLSRGAPPCGICLAIPAVPRRQELPYYETHALFEAVRARSAPCVLALLNAAEIDPNQPATTSRFSALGDAAARGDAEMCALLLSDERVDPGAAAGGVIALHGALLAAMVGSVPTLAAFARVGALSPSLQPALTRTAAANGRTAALAFLQGFYIHIARWAALPPFEAAVAVHLAVTRIGGADSDGLLDSRAFEAVLAVLGIALSADEMEEAFAALNSTGDGRVNIDALSAWLLGDAAWREALESAVGAGENGYAGVAL